MFEFAAEERREEARVKLKAALALAVLANRRTRHALADRCRRSVLRVRDARCPRTGMNWRYQALCADVDEPDPGAGRSCVQRCGLLG